MLLLATYHGAVTTACRLNKQMQAAAEFDAGSPSGAGRVASDMAP
jgi:hypothetical protein